MERAKLASGKLADRAKLSIGDCPGIRPNASRRQRSSYAATAALTT